MKWALASAMVLCGGLTACGSSPKPALPAPATASGPAVSASASGPAPAAADASAEAKEQILAAYRGMWAAKTRAYTTGTLVGSEDLETYAGDKALAAIKVTAVYYQDHNMVLRGAPVLSPTVTAVEMDASPRRATITDCVDTAGFVAVDKASGTPVKTTDDNRRHPQTSLARVFNGRWTIMETTISRDQTC